MATAWAGKVVRSLNVGGMLKLLITSHSSSCILIVYLDKPLFKYQLLKNVIRSVIKCKPCSLVLQVISWHSTRSEFLERVSFRRRIGVISQQPHFCITMSILKGCTLINHGNSFVFLCNNLFPIMPIR